METYLILVAIGPVQEFIAQARRTRDLWYGSELLSDLSRSVAKSLAENGATLIFPDSAEGRKNVANKILARLDADDEAVIREAVVNARAALYSEWKRLAARVQSEAEHMLSKEAGAGPLWDEQIESLLEFVAVWRLEGGDYVDAREGLESALAARKNIREFAPWLAQKEGVSKSSLDGARQSVLRPRDKRNTRLFAQFRINGEEQLDAVGLVKRMGGNAEQFVPLANVALGPWLLAARERVPEALESMRALCETPRDEHAKFTRIRSELAHVKCFPFDAQVFLPDRAGPIAKELYPASKKDDDDDLFEKYRSLRDELQRAARKAFGREGMREPHPYVACLVADGDYMGATLNELRSYEQHKLFSAELTKFAAKAKEIVEGHLGSLVYSGGDDVLAFVSVPKALACAEALRVAFKELMNETLAAMKVTVAKPPTLSVGIGVGHVLESMGYLLTLGRDAEKLAKGGALKDRDQRRDALAIMVDKRSGGMARVRARWETDPVTIMEKSIRQLNDFTLPTGKVYEVRTFIRRMPSPSQIRRDLAGAASEGEREQILEEANSFRELLEFDVRRILGRAGDVKGVTADEVGLDLKSTTYLGLYESIERWVERVLIAKLFAESERSLSPKGGR